MNYASQAHALHHENNVFSPFSEPIKKAVWFFWEKISWILSKWFQPFSKKESSSNTFSGLFWNTPSTHNDTSFIADVPTKQFKDNLEADLQPTNFKKAPFLLSSASFVISDDARFYSYDGKYIDTFSKNTKVFASVSKDVFFHEGKAFIYIDGHTHTSDRKTTIETWYLRAVWLDTYLQEKPQEIKKAPISASLFSPKVSTLTNTPSWTSLWTKTSYYNSQPRKNIFSWYMAPNWEEIPDYIIKAVTINYFGKIIKPKIEDSIKQTDVEIAQTREMIIKKSLETKSPHTTVLQSQKEKISKKHKLTALSQAIQEAYWWKEDAFENQDLKNIILSMQKKPEWQDIILKSYTVKKNMKKRKK